MITLAVDVITGHYTIPGPTMSGAGGLVPTYPIAPPSTVRGFLRSFCGKEEDHPVSFTYGYRAAPGGRGQLLRKASVWASKQASVVGEVTRPLHFDTFLDLRYWITVETDFDLLRSALEGTVPRYGPLFLGESYDLVTSVREIARVEDEGGGCAVVPGRTVVMPWVSGRGYGVRNAEFRGWDLVGLQ